MRQSETSRFSAGRATALLAVLAAVTAVRAFVLVRAENIARDGTVYLQMARDFTRLPAAEVCRSYDYHPAYSMAVAAVAGVFGADWPDGWIVVGQLISVAMSGVALVAIYLIATAAFDRRVALASVLLFGLAPSFTKVSCNVLSDAQAVAMVAAALAMGLWAARDVRAGRWRAVLLAAGAGAFGGIGYLTRPEELLGSVIVLAMLLAAGRRAGRRVQLAAVAATIVATLAFVLPYATAIGALTQKKSLEDFVAGGGAMLACAAWTPELLGAVLRTLDRHQAVMGIVVGIPFLVYVATWMGRSVFRLRLPAQVRISPTRPGAFAMFAAAAVMFPLLVALEFNRGPGYVSSRHALMSCILLAPCAGAGVMIIRGWLAWFAGPGAGGKLAQLVICILVVVAAGFAGLKAAPTLHKDKGCYRAAGEAFRRRFGDGYYALAADGWTPFFAGAPAGQFRRGADMPYHLRPGDLASVEALWARATGAGANRRGVLLAISGQILARSQNKQIIADLQTDSRFEFVNLWTCTDRHRVWLFRIPPAATHGDDI